MVKRPELRAIRSIGQGEFVMLISGFGFWIADLVGGIHARSGGA
jgi:hypothetical protein